MTASSPNRLSDDAGLISLTYLSECRIEPADLAHEIEHLVETAQVFNDANQVTGALLFTGRRFVETLEGPAKIVDALIAAIACDVRHSGLLVIDRRDIDRRAFARWKMAYAGPSVFVSRSLERALVPSHPNFSDAVARLLQLIAEFARQSAPPAT